MPSRPGTTVTAPRQAPPTLRDLQRQAQTQYSPQAPRGTSTLPAFAEGFTQGFVPRRGGTLRGIEVVRIHTTVMPSSAPVPPASAMTPVPREIPLSFLTQFVQPRRPGTTVTTTRPAPQTFQDLQRRSQVQIQPGQTRASAPSVPISYHAPRLPRQPGMTRTLPVRREPPPCIWWMDFYEKEMAADLREYMGSPEGSHERDFAFALLQIRYNDWLKWADECQEKYGYARKNPYWPFGENRPFPIPGRPKW